MPEHSSPLMYPHKLDRYRVFGVLFRRLIDNLSGTRTREAIAKAAGASRADISNLCRLEKSLDSQGRTVGRARVIKILNQGLCLRQAEIEALLWLYDGNPLSQAEISQLPNFRFKTYESDDLRHLVVDLMGRVVSLQEEVHEAKVQIVFQMGDQSRLTGAQKFMDLEARKGFLLVIQKHISGLLYPRNKPYILRSIANQSAMRDANLRIQYRGFQIQRHNRAQADPGNYGLRTIHSEQALSDYFAGKTHHTFSLAERRNQIAYLIDLLTERVNFQIGLVERTPRIEVEIKSTEHVVVRAALEESYKSSSWGAHYIFFDDELSVLSFLWDFERQWIEIPQNKRGLAVVDFLKDLGRKIGL